MEAADDLASTWEAAEGLDAFSRPPENQLHRPPRRDELDTT
jgi:hypothetical protein